MEGLGLDGKDISMGGGGYPVVVVVLLGGGASGSVVWNGAVVHVRGNYEGGGGNPCMISNSYHG